MLSLPILIFVVVNLLKFGAGIAFPYDVFATLGRQLRLTTSFDLLSPVIFMGGALAAIALSLAAQISARVESAAGIRVLTAVGIRIHPWTAAVLLSALAALTLLLAYVAAENLAELLRAGSI